MSLGWMLFIISITNTITIIAMAMWLDKLEKDEQEDTYYYENRIYDNDDDEDENLNNYKWED